MRNILIFLLLVTVGCTACKEPEVITVPEIKEQQTWNNACRDIKTGKFTSCKDLEQ